MTLTSICTARQPDHPAASGDHYTPQPYGIGVKKGICPKRTNGGHLGWIYL